MTTITESIADAVTLWPIVVPIMFLALWRTARYFGLRWCNRCRRPRWHHRYWYLASRGWNIWRCNSCGLNQK
jgi:hypothetical protein